MTSAKRVAQFADVPTVAEAGVPGFAVDNWYGSDGAARNAEAHRRQAARQDESHSRPARRQRAAGSARHFSVSGAVTEAYGDYVKAEIKKYAKVVQDSGVRID